MVGHLRSPEEFIAEASDLMHPLDAHSTLDDLTKQAIFDIVTMGPLELTKARLTALKHIQATVKSLESEEKTLHEQTPKHLNKILRNKNLLTFKRLLQELSYPDTGIVDEIINGFHLVGTTSPSNVFPKHVVPASMTMDELKSRAEMQRKSLASQCVSSGDPAMDQELWNKTLEEIESGWILGPFTETEVSKLLNTVAWNVCPRFALVQKDKIRVIDDGKRGSINSALTTVEKLTLHDVDFLAAMLKTVLEICSSPVIYVGLSIGTWLEGVLERTSA